MMLECFFCFENAVIENLFIVLHFTGIVILSHRYKQFFFKVFYVPRIENRVLRIRKFIA